MKALFKILVPGLLLAAALPATAQRDPRFTVAWPPLHALTSTARFDLEFRLQERCWLQLGLYAHSFSNNDGETVFEWLSGDEDILRLRGHGAGITYKYFFHRWFYYSAGITYNNYRARYISPVMHSFEEDGLTFHEYLENQEVRQTFNKFSTASTVGLQSTFRHVFFIDVYAGLGYAYSFRDESKRAYDSGPFTMGYRGIFPTAGTRLGVSF